MSLSYIGPKGSHESRWITYALLRDNLLHHGEQGEAKGAFSSLYEITEALGGKRVMLSAVTLADELRRAQELLRDIPASDLAVSRRTQAAISFSLPLPPLGETRLLRELLSGIPQLSVRNGVPLDAFGGSFLRGDPKTLGDIFEEMLGALLAVTEGADADSQVEVVDT